MSKTKIPKSGGVTIGKKPLWEMLLEADEASRARWTELRAKGWFTINDVMNKTGWSQGRSHHWAGRNSLRRELLLDPANAKYTSLHEPKAK